LISWRSLIAVEVEFRAIIAVHACALRMLSERPAQKDVGFRKMRCLPRASALPIRL
jgi:hypothetical protein